MSHLEDLPQELKSRVEEIIAKYPPSEEVFVSLMNFLIQQKSNDDPKRKKTQESLAKSTRALTPSNSLESLQGTNIMLQLPDLSIQSPFRRRLNLVFGAVKGEKKAYLALSKSLESKPELILRDITPGNAKFACILNVPEKKALRYLLVCYNQNEGNVYKNEPLLIQFNHDILQEQFGSLLGGKTFSQYLTSQLALVDFKVIDCALDDTFSVPAYKKTKEGYLFFLPEYIIFGFKKPIDVFKSSDIVSITYDCITRMTFNVHLEVKVGSETQKHEYSMIDQKEFENIDKYVKLKEVKDNSMSDEHKAQSHLKNNSGAPGDLAEAAKLVPGGEQLIPNGNTAKNDVDDEDDDDDDNYQVGDSDDNHSDVSAAADYEDEEVEKEEEDGTYNEYVNENAPSSTFTPGTLGSLAQFGGFDENLQQELQDLQKDLDLDINELQKAGYI